MRYCDAILSMRCPLYISSYSTQLDQRWLSRTDPVSVCRYQAVREIRLCPAEEVNFCKFSYDINRCGISYFILVTVFYVTGPFLLFFRVACHLLFEKLYFRNLECLVILCTSSVYVYELQ